MRRAVFFDKDGTLVQDLPYNADPARLVLRPGAGNALKRLRAAGFALVIVTNQPGIALGRCTPRALDRLGVSLARQLERDGAAIAGFYYCPHHPKGVRAAFARRCVCRKPRSGLLRRAATDLRLDLRRSWMVGDILDDVEAGVRAGCRTVLLDVGSETEWLRGARRTPDAMVHDLAEAADFILECTSQRGQHE